MVRPRAKVFCVGTLNVLAVAIGGESVPCLCSVVVEDSRVGKVVTSDFSGREMKETSTIIKSVS